MTNVAERRPQGARRARLAALATIAAALISVEARAVTPEDRAAADQLFNDGRAAVKTGNYEVGCAKLASSQALDPTSGTLLALGDCYELAGRTASAWATFSDAAAMAANAKDQAREEEATRRADALAPRLSKLVVELPADEKSAADLKVVRNGKPMEVSTLGAAIPVDPGNQKVEVTLPGRKPWSGEVTVPFGPGTTTLVVPALERALGVAFLPGSIYVISRMPSQPLAADIVPITLIALLLAFVATLYPSWRASRIQPAEALRYE